MAASFIIPDQFKTWFSLFIIEVLVQHISLVKDQLRRSGGPSSIEIPQALRVSPAQVEIPEIQVQRTIL